MDREARGRRRAPAVGCLGKASTGLYWHAGGNAQVREDERQGAAGPARGIALGQRPRLPPMIPTGGSPPAPFLGHFSARVPTTR